MNNSLKELYQQKGLYLTEIEILESRLHFINLAICDIKNAEIKNKRMVDDVLKRNKA